VVWRLWGSLLAETLDVGSEVGGPEGGEGVVRGVVELVERGWMAEKNWVMAGWEWSVVRR
jgi:hypothetical protein